MNIIIDIGHPAHVHLFKHFAKHMIAVGHRVLFTTREKEVALHLLNHYRFDFLSFGKPYKRVPGKLWGLLKFDFMLLNAARKFKPDLFLSGGSIYAAHAAFLLRKPHFAFEDTGNMEQVRLYKPFTRAIFVSTSFKKDLGKRQVFYNGYHELAYLHPARFQPDPSVLDLLGVKSVKGDRPHKVLGGSVKGDRPHKVLGGVKGDRPIIGPIIEPYIVLRFVSWSASHDAGQSGISLQRGIEIVKTLSDHARVFISYERGIENLPPELRKYGITIPPERMHDVLAFASLYIGEGATMASECAVLGTPSIYVNSITAGSLEEQERYGLLFGFRNSHGVLEKAVQLLQTPNLKAQWQERRQKMLSEKCDVTDFMVRFIENYPTKTKKN